MVDGSAVRIAVDAALMGAIVDRALVGSLVDGAVVDAIVAGKVVVVIVDGHSCRYVGDLIVAFRLEDVFSSGTPEAPDMIPSTVDRVSYLFLDFGSQ